MNYCIVSLNDAYLYSQLEKVKRSSSIVEYIYYSSYGRLYIIDTLNIFLSLAMNPSVSAATRIRLVTSTWILDTRHLILVPGFVSILLTILSHPHLYIFLYFKYSINYSKNKLVGTLNCTCRYIF